MDPDDIPADYFTDDSHILHAENARLREVNAELLRACKVIRELMPEITIRDVIQSGDEAINSVGMNPWAIREGLATGDEPISLRFLDEAIAKAEEDAPRLPAYEPADDANAGY